MKSFLYCLGDVHLSSNAAWSHDLGEKFIEWFSSWVLRLRDDDRDNVSHELVVLGDVTEKDLLSGSVVSLMYRLFAEATADYGFDGVYVLPGNHDLRYYKGRLNYSVEFARHMQKVRIIDKESFVTTTGGFDLMCLPFRKLEDGRSIDDYYSNGLPSEFYAASKKIIVGHVAIQEEFKKYGGIDISKFNSDNHWALGHLHTRAGAHAEKYSGSVTPNKIDEERTTLPRGIKRYSLVGGTVERMPLIPIPKMIAYKDVVYPLDIVDDPSEKELIKVYTVANCRSMILAKDKYKGKYIRAVQYVKKRTGEDGVSIGGASVKKMSTFEALGVMVKERKLPIKRSVMSYLSTVFAPDAG